MNHLNWSVNTIFILSSLGERQLVVSTPDPKRQKVESIVFRDVENELDGLLSSINKFKLFNNISVDAFLNGLEQYLNHTFGTCEVIVKHFFHLIDEMFYEWYYKTVSDYDDISWEGLKSAFKLVVDTYSFELSSYLHLDLDNFLEKISKFESLDFTNEVLIKPNETYFRTKIKYVKMIYNLDDKNSKLFALSALNSNDKFVAFKDYVNLDSMFYLHVRQEDKKLIQIRQLNDKRDRHARELELCNKLKDSLKSIKTLENQLKDKEKLEEEVKQLKQKLDAVNKG